MSLYKRGRIWWCEWEIGGQRVRETTGTADRKSAQEYHDRRRADLWRAARLGEIRPPTWDEAALDWIDEHAVHKKSYETDRQRLAWLTAELTGKPITAINNDLLLTLRGKQIKDGNAPATANRYLAIVSAVLNYANSKGKLAAVPKIPYLPEPKERFRFLTQPQARALIDQLPLHLAHMTRFALATGLRRSNITGLTWDAVDTERKVAWVWADEAKAGKPIPVPLNDDALAVIKERDELKNKKGESLRHKVFVFHYRKKPVFHTTTKAWAEALARAKIEAGFTFHDLRHTWASWHVMSGTPLEVLRQLGGWADMTMVLRYAHLAPGYVAAYAGNVSLTKSPTAMDTDTWEQAGNVDGVGWLMGLEPTTTGITILPKGKKAA